MSYNREAVDEQIDAHNRRRRGARIGRKEARRIHALLQDRPARAWLDALQDPNSEGPE